MPISSACWLLDAFALVLILSAHSDDAYVEEATTVGAVGFLLKQTSSHVLATAIREVQKGNRFFSPSITKHLHRHFQQSPKSGALIMKKGDRLTSREAEVLQLIAEGQANKQVASELGISVKTVEKHRQRLMEKLSIHDTAGLKRGGRAQRFGGTFSLRRDGRSVDATCHAGCYCRFPWLRRIQPQCLGETATRWNLRGLPRRLPEDSRPRRGFR